MLVGAALLFAASADALATGVHRDYSRPAHFLIAPAGWSVEGWAANTETVTGETVTYNLAAVMPFRLFLFRLELPFVSSVTSEAINEGFGDPSLRLRFAAWSRRGAALNILAGVRAGSLPFFLSDETLFPFSTGSLDFSAGLAFADTVQHLAYWAAGTVTLPTRVDDALEQSGRYRKYSELQAGIRLPVDTPVAALMGAAVYVPAAGPARQIFFADVDWRYSTSIGFFGYGQVESGTPDSRASDYSVGLGSQITF